jgi:hypothetical protein
MAAASAPLAPLKIESASSPIAPETAQASRQNEETPAPPAAASSEAAPIQLEKAETAPPLVPSQQPELAPTPLPSQHPEPLTRKAITAAKKAMIRASIDAYDGSCPCPYNYARNGSRCGRRSAYDREGGESPLCFEHDLTEEMVREFLAGRE